LEPVAVPSPGVVAATTLRNLVQALTAEGVKGVDALANVKTEDEEFSAVATQVRQHFEIPAPHQEETAGHPFGSLPPTELPAGSPRTRGDRPPCDPGSNEVAQLFEFRAWLGPIDSQAGSPECPLSENVLVFERLPQQILNLYTENAGFFVISSLRGRLLSAFDITIALQIIEIKRVSFFLRLLHNWGRLGIESAKWQLSTTPSAVFPQTGGSARF